MTPDPIVIGFCTRIRPSGKKKIRYASAADAAMALLDIKDWYLRQGKDLTTVPIRYYECHLCAGGFHLTSMPVEIRPCPPKGLATSA